MNYQNPIIPGFYPDPSICCVNGNYYLAASSFEYFPGIPLFHSTDLINWEQIGNCITRSEQLSFERMGNSGGIWAPTIRYNNGTFYITATVDHMGNMIISTDDIYGEWSDPVWVSMGGIDPSIYFENDRAYYCTNANALRGTEAISIAEIEIKTGALKSGITPIWAGIHGGWLEAPHIYHIGDWYYILTAEGGTSYNHMITVGRSRSLFGPYESCPHNPILTNRDDTTKQILCSGHGDLICDNDGRWWMVHLGTRPCKGSKTNLGRETFLTPVQWVDEWPVVNGKKAKIENTAPSHTFQKKAEPLFFDFAQTDREPQWLFLRNPNPNAYERGAGQLTLHPSSHGFEEPDQPTFMAVRQPDFECTAETRFRFDTKEIGDEAGIIIYLQSDFYYRIGKQKKADGDYIVIEKKAEDFVQTAYAEKIPDGELKLSITADKDNYSFYYAVGGGAVNYACKASTRFLCAEVADRCFTGTLIGLYALCSKRTNSAAIFTEFSVLPFIKPIKE